MRWAKELYSLGSIKGEKLEQLYLFTSVLGRHQVDEEVSGTDSPRIYMPSTRQLVGNKSCARNVPLPGPPENPALSPQRIAPVGARVVAGIGSSIY